MMAAHSPSDKRYKPAATTTTVRATSATTTEVGYQNTAWETQHLR